MEISVEPCTIFDLFIPVGMHRIVIDFATWVSEFGQQQVSTKPLRSASS
jgi:hypothetical protein